MPNWGILPQGRQDIEAGLRKIPEISWLVGSPCGGVNAAVHPDELRQAINDSPFYQLMGIRLVEIAPGHSRLEADVRDAHLNVYGTVHGGLCAALVDCAVGTALIGDLAQVSRPSPTVEMKVNYLAPVTEGRLVAEGRLMHRGRTLAVGTAEVRNGEGTLVAVGTATYLSGGPQEERSPAP